MLEQIGNNLKQEREKLNLSINELAHILKISKESIYKTEKGERMGKTFIKYLIFLTNKKIDLNKIFKIRS